MYVVFSKFFQFDVRLLEFEDFNCYDTIDAKLIFQKIFTFIIIRRITWEKFKDTWYSLLLFSPQNNAGVYWFYG